MKQSQAQAEATNLRSAKELSPFAGRREFLGKVASVALAAGAAAGVNASHAAAKPAGSRIVVGYFTRTGNTRVIAHHIRRALQADIFEIEPATGYPEDYEATVRQAERERDSGFRPPLKAVGLNIASYESVFLGFPIWGETIPPVIRSFVAQHDLAGKTLVPFITHGGYGQGGSIPALRQLAPRARLLNPFVLEADQERRTVAQVSNWLSRVNIRA